ncbi:hypothetical protein [Aquabacterium sp.]|uniref:hypothetical protein n=1 Tax=Aquabacterium sp. TaxID=1872578 RepID=UPI0019C18C06|nr:hypothetical protein [Aquabacterium sp.]MBC7699992.1 hypothetical protein [Aquabacterium sp.]
MHDEERSEQMRQKLLDMQAALFNLRDGLVNLSLSLQELSLLTDETAQREASQETDDLLLRLRG